MAVKQTGGDGNFALFVHRLLMTAYGWNQLLKNQDGFR